MDEIGIDGAAGRQAVAREANDPPVRQASRLRLRLLAPIRGQGQGGASPRWRPTSIKELPLSSQEQPAFASPPLGTAAHASLLLPRAPASRSTWHYLFEREGWTSIRLLADLLTSLVAVLVVMGAHGGVLAVGRARPALLAFPLLVTVMLHARGMYRRRVRVVIIDDLAPIVGAISVAAMALLSWQVVVHGDVAAGFFIGRVWALTLVLLGGVRLALAVMHRRVRATRLVGKPTLIVGAGIVGTAIARRLEEQPEYGLRPIGFVDSDPRVPAGAEERSLPVLGSPVELAEIARASAAEHVIFAFINEPDHGLIALVRRCDEVGVEVSLVPRLFESMNDRLALERIGNLPLLAIETVDPKGWQFSVKYVLDRPLALLGLVVWAPVLALVAMAVKLSSPGPILFRQRRVGRDGQVFDMLKFRSMRLPERDEPFEPDPGHAPGGVEGTDRRTPIGRFLRRSALDELPQLVNVLRGEMSLVGPRPERPEFAQLFGRDLARYTDRHRVKSGITGWAQVSGLRGQTSLPDRVEWDNYYIENWSLGLDLKILLLTLGAVLRSGDDA